LSLNNEYRIFFFCLNLLCKKVFTFVELHLSEPHITYNLTCWANPKGAGLKLELFIPGLTRIKKGSELKVQAQSKSCWVKPIEKNKKWEVCIAVDIKSIQPFYTLLYHMAVDCSLLPQIIICQKPKNCGQ
jgi:hypothetical protein